MAGRDSGDGEFRIDPRIYLNQEKPTVTVDQNTQEVKLSVKDLISIIGIAITVIAAVWGFSVRIESGIAVIGERMRSLDQRIQLLETGAGRLRPGPRPDP